MNRIISVIALVLATLTPLTGCAALLAEPIEGKVLEKDTHKPIAGAIVIVRWKERIPMGLIDSRTECTHVESTTTDSDGRYRLPGWKSDALWLLNVYKAGYEEGGRDEGIVYLKLFGGTREERLQYLLRVLGATGCSTDRESKKNRIPLLKGMYEEALNLARNDQDQKIVEAIRYSLEILELGFEEAEKRHLQRVR